MFDGLLGDKDALLALAAQLMSAKKGQEGQAFAQGLLGAMATRNQNQDRAQQGLMRQQDLDMRRLQMDQMRGQMGRQQKLDELPGQFFRPESNPHGPMPDGDSMPAIPAKNDHAGYANALRGLDPGKAQAYEAQQAQLNQKQQPKYHVVNGSLVPEPTVPGQQSAPAFTAPEKTPDWLDPRYVEIKKAIAAAGRPQVSIDQRLENKESQEKGALNVKDFGAIQEAAQSARRSNAVLSGLEKIPLDTGKLTPANVTVSAWMAALGGGERFKQKAAQGEGFTGLATELVLQKQMAQKGPQTESDARRLEQTVANAGNRQESNALLIGFDKAQNQRVIDQHEFYQKWWKENKTYEGAADAWFKGKGGMSLWDEPSLKKFQGAGGAILRFDANGNPK